MKLELLALKWAIVEKFRGYFLGSRFTVITDNNPLCHLKTAKFEAIEQRWVSQLSVFDFDVQYRPGYRNKVADALSRQPFSRKPDSVSEDAQYDGCVVVCGWIHRGTDMDVALVVAGMDSCKVRQMQAAVVSNTNDGSPQGQGNTPMFQHSWNRPLSYNCYFHRVCANTIGRSSISQEHYLCLKKVTFV